MISNLHPRTGLTLAVMRRAAMASTSISSHEARIAHQQRGMHMTIDQLRAMSGGHLDGDTDEPVFVDRSAANAKATRRAGRLGDVPVVINRRPPPKPKRKSRAKTATA